MAYSVALDAYNGPLDLLLELITQKRLEINEISLTKVIEQYLAYIEEHDLPAKELSDFLVVAARLLHLKTKALLPYLYVETEQDEVLLEQQLKIYKVYWNASKKVNALYAGKIRLFAKSKAVISDVPIFSPPSKKQITTDKLKSIFFTIINGLEEIIELPKTTIKRAVSLTHRIARLKEMLGKVSRLKFKHFVYGADNLTDVIVNFLAVLELIKQREIDIDMSTGGEVVLKKL